MLVRWVFGLVVWCCGVVKLSRQVFFLLQEGAKGRRERQGDSPEFKNYYKKKRKGGSEEARMTHASRTFHGIGMIGVRDLLDVMAASGDHHEYLKIERVGVSPYV